MNLLELNKSGSWSYLLTISPETPADTIRLVTLIHTHSEYQSQFDRFLDDDLISFIIARQPEKKSRFNYLHVTQETLVGNTSVLFKIHFIFGHDINIHEYDDAFFKLFEKRIVNYFENYYIKVEGK